MKSIHCVGVAGMGVGPLAIYLAQAGFSVSGEDDAMIEAMRVHLERAGVALTVAGGVPANCDLVVYSSAISPAHPAFIAASSRKIPLVRRGELLAEVVRDKKLVAICGSHGKTTTTAMLVTALRRANFPAVTCSADFSMTTRFRLRAPAQTTGSLRRSMKATAPSIAFHRR
ncbi:MAG: Mur ligase domain-containing protein [Nibricoccus sp.]